MKSSWMLAAIVVTCLECQGGKSSPPANHPDLIPELARDTTIIVRSDRVPDIAALGRLLDRLGIHFNERLARSETDCLVNGKQALASPTVSCRIRDGVEPLLLHILADTAGYRELQVLNGAQIVQHIDLADFERPDSAARALYAADLDGDDAREVIMQRFAGATGNTGFTVWRVDPVARRLKEDSTMSAMSTLIRMPGRPCVYQSWNTSAYDNVALIDCYLDKRWRRVWETSMEWERGPNRIVRKQKVMVGDTVRLIRADTLPIPE